MNPRLAGLHPYPFQRLAQLTRDVRVNGNKPPVNLSVGEPKHPAPQFVLDEIAAHLQGVASYPFTRGTADLRAVVAAWASRRFGLDRVLLNPERHILPACGTREALFSIAQTVIDPAKGRAPVVILPNPFYQIYEGAALLAGAEPYYLNTTADNGYKMNFAGVPDEIWHRTQLVYVCSPGNPTGAVMDVADFSRLIGLAEQHDFVIASDECYSEIYFDEDHPPAGLLQAANGLGVEDYRRCLAFHSLSKRSNLPGLRSGFIAGDGALMSGYLQYRTYHGCTISSLAQAVSIGAWRDEQHVFENREKYRAKFSAVLDILGPVMEVRMPEAGFYLWPRVPMDDERFTRELFAHENVLVLPGSYLSRDAHGVNPGAHHARLALVATVDECVDAAVRIRNFVQSL